MADRRFDEIVEGLHNRIEAVQRSRETETAQRQGESEFASDWHNCYSEDTESTCDALLRLESRIEDRFWDFHLSDMLATEHWHITGHSVEISQLALRILCHACRGDRPTVSQCLQTALPFRRDIAHVHSDIWDMLLRRDASSQPPPTPPLNRKELSRVANVTYDALSGAIKAEHWKPVASDNVSHKRRKRWKHVEDDVQKRVLIQIRKECPEKIWPSRDAQS